MTLPQSLKGHVFEPGDPDTLPTFVQRMASGERKQWAARETERMRLVHDCAECGESLIAEEVREHYLSAHLSDRERVLARTIVSYTLDERERVMEVLEAIE